MTLKLNQVIALVGGRKTAISKLLTEVHHGWKEERFRGLTRVYRRKDDDGEQFPAEKQLLQLRVLEELNRVQNEIGDFWDLVATQETANTRARADILIDEEVIASQVPVTVLLFLEKQLTDLATLVGKLPTLSVDKFWKLDPGNRCYVTEPEQTVKTRKTPKVIVKYEATKEHPAQTEMIASDETIGWWDTTHVSGAIPESMKHAFLQRVEKLRDAVKVAREAANSIETGDVSISEDLLNYLFENQTRAQDQA